MSAATDDEVVFERPQRHNHVLPQHTADLLKHLHKDYLKKWEAAKRQHLPAPPSMSHAYMLELRDAGWTLVSIANALGVTRARVEQILRMYPEDEGEYGTTGLPVPAPPVVMVVKKRRTVPQVPAATAQRLRYLQAQAAKHRPRDQSWDSARAVAAVESTHLMVRLWREGVGTTTIARAIGVSNSTVQHRLMRAGVMAIPPSQKMFAQPERFDPDYGRES